MLVALYPHSNPINGGYEIMTKEQYQISKPWQPTWHIIEDWQTFLNQSLQYVEKNIQELENALKECQK